MNHQTPNGSSERENFISSYRLYAIYRLGTMRGRGVSSSESFISFSDPCAIPASLPIQQRKNKNTIGKFLSTVTKVVTLPLDAVSSGMDLMCGGDGSKKSRTQDSTPLGLLEELRDKITETMEDIDE